MNSNLPCAGTADRQLICQDMFDDIVTRCECYSNCEWFLAGDLNTNLSVVDNTSSFINSFAAANSLSRCDVLFNKVGVATYVNEALRHSSSIDYMLVTECDKILNFDIIDPSNNFSDHLPLFSVYECAFESNANTDKRRNYSHPVLHYRWDHADINSYNDYTGC